MMDLSSLGKALLMMAGLMALAGLALLLAARMPFLGRLPGDIAFHRGNMSCYVPIVTSILLSVLLTLAVNLIARLVGR